MNAPPGYPGGLPMPPSHHQTRALPGPSEPANGPHGHQQPQYPAHPEPSGPSIPPYPGFGPPGEPEPPQPVQTTLFGNVPFAVEDKSRIRRSLGMQLGPEFVATRQGPGGSKLSYIEGWKVVNLANEIFGFDGWSSQIINTTVDYCEVDARGISLGCSCTVRVTLKDGTFREDVGWGSISNAKDKAMAFEKVRKEAATDALKRSLKNFGNALGNCLYDKEYCKMIPKVRGENSGPLDPNNLLRPSDLKDYPQVRTDGLSNRLKSMDEHWDHQHPPPALQPQQAGNPPPPQQPPYAGAPNQPPHLAAAAPNPGYGQQPGMSGPAAYAHPPQGPPPGYGPPMPDAKRTSPPKHAMPAQQPQQQPQQHQQQQQHRLIANNPGPYQAQGAIEPAKTAASTALAPAIGEPEFDSFEMDPDISFASDESKEIVAGDLENLQTELLVGVKPVLNQQPAIAQAKSAPPQQSLGAINDAKRARAQAMQREWQERNRSNQNQKQNQNQGSGNEASGNSNGIGWSAESTRTTPPEKAPQPLAVPPAAPFKPAPLAPLKSAAPSAEPNPAEMQTPPTVAFDSQGGDAGFEAKFTSAASMIGGPAAKAPSIPVPAPAPAPQPQPQLVTNENGQPPGLGAVNLNAPLATPRTLRTRRGGGTGSNSLSRGQQAPFKIPGPAAASPSVDRAIKPFSAPGPMIGLSPSKRGVPFGGPGGMGQKRPFDQVN